MGGLYGSLMVLPTIEVLAMHVMNEPLLGVAASSTVGIVL